MFRSNRYIYAQVIDDQTGRTLAAASSQEAALRKRSYGGDRHRGRKASGGNEPRTQESQAVVFDRGGFAYHGRIKALADAAREAGLDF